MKKIKTDISSGTTSFLGGQSIKNAGIDSQANLDEKTLLHRSRSGNMAAFAQLIERHQNRLFNAILRTVGNYDDAQELTQETFYRALRGLRKFRGNSGFYTWLFRIGINLSINHRQRRNKIRFKSLSGSNEGLGHQADALANLADSKSHSPGHTAQLRQEHHRALQALEKLEPQARAIVVLRDIEELDYSQIAEILEVPLGTVKSRLARARMALRKQLIEPTND